MNTSKETVMGYLEAFGAGDVNKALSFVDDNAVWRVDGSPLVPTVGIVKGKDRVGQWLTSFPNAFTPKKFVVNALVAEREHVFLTGSFRHQVHTPGAACEREQRLIDGPFTLHFVVQKGKITRYQIFEDSLAIGRAFDPNAVCQRLRMRINGVSYAYNDIMGTHADEKNPVLLFAHGLFMNGGMFAEQVKELSQTHRCIVLDMPGHGESAYDPSGWTLESMAHDFATIIQELCLGPAVFIGHSQGAMVGMRLALTNPELLHSLVLINTSAQAEPSERQEYWKALRSTILSGDSEARKELYTCIQRRMSNEAWLQQNTQAATRELAEMLTEDRLGIALATDAAVINRSSIVSNLSGITIPTLVVSGADDEATTPKMGREIASAISGSQFVLMPGVKHHIPTEAPHELLAAIQAFIN